MLTCFVFRENNLVAAGAFCLVEGSIGQLDQLTDIGAAGSDGRDSYTYCYANMIRADMMLGVADFTSEFFGDGGGLGAVCVLQLVFELFKNFSAIIDIGQAVMIDHVVQFLQRLNLVGNIEENVDAAYIAPVFNQIRNTKLIGPRLLAFCQAQTEALVIAADQLAAMIEIIDRPAFVRLSKPAENIDSCSVIVDQEPVFVGYDQALLDL